MNRFLALKASAGSGKTFNLVIRYISLLFMGAKSEEILTLTFTNKASNEMKSRIFDVIKNLDTNDSKYKSYLETISKNLNKSPHALIKQKEVLFSNFLISDIKIMTIDKFLNRILRSFCWHVNLNNDFNIKGDKREFIKSQFLKSLSEEELKVVIDFSHYQEKGLKDLFDLFYTFNSKDKELPKLNFKEFNSNLNEKILKEAFKIKDFYNTHPKASKSATNAVNFNSVEELLERGKTWLSKDLLREFSYFKKKDLHSDSLEEVFNNLKPLLIEYFEQKETIALKRLFHLYEIFKKYRLSYKKSKNELNFDDVTNLTYHLLRDDELENQFLYFRLDSQISHILMDEFQDTSVIQFEILEPIIDEIIVSQERTFFYVGDTKQSIYRFRGGKRELFDNLIQKYNFKVDNLNTNYRSKEVIVDFVNRIFRDKIYGYVKQNANLPTNRGGFVEILKGEEYFQALKDTVEKLLNSGVKESDITILAFKNSDILKIKDFLEDSIEGVKIVTDTTSKLINQQSVKAIINFMKYLYFKEKGAIYKANFFALIGENPFQDINYLSYNLFDKPVNLINQISHNYTIFDENILKFIELSFNFKDLTEFIYEIDFLDSSMATKISDGIKVMTIHKSKGLEFKHLIVFDSIGKKAPDRNSIIFDYDNIILKDIKYKLKYREGIDKDYSEVVKKEKGEQLIDSINTLYVAFTRAEYSLFIIAKEKTSEFDILNLINESIGELKIEQKKEKEDLKKEAFEIETKNWGRQNDIIKEEIEYKPNDMDAIQFGLATHYMFENLNGFDLDSLKLAKEKTNNKYGIALGERIETIYNSVKETLKNTKFINLIGGEIYKELPFIYKSEIKRIDLMVEKESDIYIIDYKTSQDNSPSYKKQVLQYKEAMREIKTKNVFAYLVFINEKGVEVREV